MPRMAASRSLHRAQKTIYRYCLGIVKTLSPEAAIQKFRSVLIQHIDNENPTVFRAVEELIWANNPEEFQHTLTRACYILINNWLAANNPDSITDLVRIFEDPAIQHSTLSHSLERLRGYLRRFLSSTQYQNLKLYAARYLEADQGHWTHRYTPYFLASQYTNPGNSQEERRIAKELADAWKSRFRLELTHYSARAGCPNAAESRNPTALGPAAVDLMKRVICQRTLFDYRDLASLFLKQTQDLTLKDFKVSLYRYLLHVSPGGPVLPALPTVLAKRLERCLQQTYPEYGSRVVDGALRLRTCNHVIELLTASRDGKPTEMFLKFVSEDAALTLIFMLLKLLLISPQSRAHLDAQIARLVEHYRHLPEKDCHWLIQFLETFQIAAVIHTDSKTQFNLVEVSQPTPLGTGERERIFAQTECPMTDEELRKLTAPRAFPKIRPQTDAF
ncbi:hypothetical protein [Leptolyngbya sp. FACHB-261]|uniref:hypothetical protein n=1 Tax=Leptolyngbya sp. FACHB-261 TaxID=2692806 RepID=UPI0016829F5C|nr:hypothetical protein [Leptolyngbya sp. FACHB-261]